jgi:hypothetical protein
LHFPQQRRAGVEDRSLLPGVEIKFSDRNARVRYGVVAAPIRVSATGENKAAKNDP